MTPERAVLLPGQCVAFPRGNRLWGHRTYSELVNTPAEPSHLVHPGQLCIIVASCPIRGSEHISRVLLLSSGGGLGWITVGAPDYNNVVVL